MLATVLHGPFRETGAIPTTLLRLLALADLVQEVKRRFPMVLVGVAVLMPSQPT